MAVPAKNRAAGSAPARVFDVAIVGAGIVGLALARELLVRRPALSVAVVDKELEVGVHQTGHNSGVIHSGFYYRPGSLKAELCVSGARELYRYCDERGIETRRCGKVVIARTAAETAVLEELRRRGEANGVSGLRIIGPPELAELEPHARGVAALHSRDTGVVNFSHVAAALRCDVESAGGTISLGREIDALRTTARTIELGHRDGAVVARNAVFCAGSSADRLAVANGADEDPRIIPFRGTYLRVVPERRHLVQSLIYPIPHETLAFLGIHFTRCIDGEVLIGPTAILVGGREAYEGWGVDLAEVASILRWPGTSRMALKFGRMGLRGWYRALRPQAIVDEASEYVPELRFEDVVRGPTGMRAQCVARDGTLVDDFVFSDGERAIHVRNAPSPAATSALSIARRIADRAERRFLV